MLGDMYDISDINWRKIFEENFLGMKNNWLENAPPR